MKGLVCAGIRVGQYKYSRLATRMLASKDANTRMWCVRILALENTNTRSFFRPRITRIITNYSVIQLFNYSVIQLLFWRMDR